MKVMTIAALALSLLAMPAHAQGKRPQAEQKKVTDDAPKVDEKPIRAVDTRPLYKRPSFWIATVLAVVVVGAGVGAIVGGTESNKLPPGGTLGVVDWR